MNGVRITPINEIIKEAKKLANDPKKNEEAINEIIKNLKLQIDIINRVDSNALNDFLATLDQSSQEYSIYYNLKLEKEEYIKNSSIIKSIINKEYDSLKENDVNKRNKGSKKKLTTLVVAGLISLAIVSFGIKSSSKKNNKNSDNNNYNNPKITSEYPDDDTIKNTNKITTESTTKLSTTENTTQVTTTENTTQVTTTENTTQAPTTEGTTQAPTTEGTTQVTTTEGTTQAPTTEGTTQVTTTESTTQATTTEDIIYDEQNSILDIFRTMKTDMIELYSSDEAKLVREKGKEYVITTVDFLFFNASINGITFKDLRSDVKEELYQILQGMDALVRQFDPDYKEELGDKYNVVKNFADEKYDAVKEKIIEKIGQDKYDEIINEKNEIFDKIVETFKKYGGTALRFIKDKYDIWKNKTR